MFGHLCAILTVLLPLPSKQVAVIVHGYRKLLDLVKHIDLQFFDQIAQVSWDNIPIPSLPPHFERVREGESTNELTGDAGHVEGTEEAPQDEESEYQMVTQGAVQQPQDEGESEDKG